MGRPPKEGIDFACWTVDMMDEPSMDQLIDSVGSPGFLVYFFLNQRAHRLHGYYLRWKLEDAASIARRIGGGVTGADVVQTVECCLKIGLFDKELWKRYGVLTGVEMQARFARVLVNRRCKEVRKELWLLEEAESCGALLV